MRRVLVVAGPLGLFAALVAVWAALMFALPVKADTIRGSSSVTLSSLYPGGTLGGALIPTAGSVEQYGIAPQLYSRCIANTVGVATLQCSPASSTTQNVSTGSGSSSIQTLNGKVTHTIKNATLASNPSDAGYTGVTTMQTAVDVLPAIYFRYLQDATIANERLFMGLATAGQNPNNAAAPTVSQAQAGGTKYIALRRDSAVVSGRWQCCSSDGTNESCTDTGVAYNASHTYLAYVAMTDAATLTCKVWQDGSLIVNTTKSTLLPATGQTLAWNITLRTLEAVIKNFYLQGVELYSY